ncbi:hypothetical protein [Escherichia sp. E2586]|uniref:hypothetical protein n=1 Tax=Escherichia sp. E2586 TaxID=2044457 RepID=UPI001F0DEFB5|nr:hypothetical protein [Escherichia sp. E2586]
MKQQNCTIYSKPLSLVRRLVMPGNLFLKTSVFINPIQNNNNFKGRNVIVIFAEGFSSEIIGNSKTDAFSITPNLDKLSTEALSFKKLL